MGPLGTVRILEGGARRAIRQLELIGEEKRTMANPTEAAALAATTKAMERAQTGAPDTRRRPFISVRVKLLVGFTLLFSVAFGVAYYWFYTFATNEALNHIQDGLRDTVTGAASGIDGDEFQALVNEGTARPDGQSDDPRYQQILAWLATVHQLEPRAYPYAYIKGEDTPLFIVDYPQYPQDPRIADPSRAAGFREAWPEAGREARLGLEKLTFQLRPYTDKWGSWVSAYAPIRNSKGETVGAVGVDFRADEVYQEQQHLRDRIAVAFAVTYAALLLLVLLVSRALTGPIRALTGAAQRIGEGEYAQDLSPLRRGYTRDEIGVLSEVFETMVRKVQSREQSLIRRVEELRIEVDVAKRQQQVSEIVDSDFFQALQNRAQELRGRRQDRATSAVPTSERE
jgi:HAMP domain-containing protein